MAKCRSSLVHLCAGLLAIGLGAGAVGALVAAGTAGAQAKEVKVAMIAPMSGPWARQGKLMQLGADMAIDDINAQGGIKALGGAKLRLVVLDAGDSAEKAFRIATARSMAWIRYRAPGARSGIVVATLSILSHIVV